MISCDFAPNEQIDDAFLSLKLLCQPGKWLRGTAHQKASQELTRYFANTHFSYFFSGRSALFHLIQSLQLPKDSSVAITTFTCSAVVLPVLHAELKPIYVDIEKETLSMSFPDLEKKTNNSTKVIILQHTFGMTPIQRDRILQFAKQKKLLLLKTWRMDLIHQHLQRTTLTIITLDSYHLEDQNGSPQFSVLQLFPMHHYQPPLN